MASANFFSSGERPRAKTSPCAVMNEAVLISATASIACRRLWFMWIRGPRAMKSFASLVPSGAEPSSGGELRQQWDEFRSLGHDVALRIHE